MIATIAAAIFLAVKYGGAVNEVEHYEKSDKAESKLRQHGRTIADRAKREWLQSKNHK